MHQELNSVVGQLHFKMGKKIKNKQIEKEIRFEVTKGSG